MEGDFYRTIQQPRWMKGITKSLFKTRRRGISVILGLLIFTFLLFNNKGIIARIQLEQERSAMIEKVKSAEAESKRLQAEIKALEGDKKTIEKVARERYGLARPGETVYKVKKD